MVNYPQKVLFIASFILYTTFIHGQTQLPICGFINEEDLKRAVSLIVGGRFIDEPPPSGSSPYFKLELNKTSAEIYDVTLSVANVRQNIVDIVVIYAINIDTNNLIGIEKSLDGGGLAECSDGDENDVYFFNNHGQESAQAEYKARWNLQMDSSNINFRASVRILDENKHEVYYYGIEADEPPDGTGGDEDHFGDDLPIDIIIYCAVAFLIAVFVISCALWCRYEVRKKRRAQEESAPLEEVVPENPSVGVDNRGTDIVQNANDTPKVETEKKTKDKGVKNAKQKNAEANSKDEVAELPKDFGAFPRTRGRVSDTIEEEILKGGGSLGHKEGRTELPRSNVRIKKMIGEGAFGEVYEAQAIGITNEPFTNVAVKILRDASVADEDFKKELKMLMTFEPHPNIIQLMGACTEKEPYFLVLEFANVGDLRAFLHKKRSATGSKILEPAQIFKFAVQIAKGMEYIESKHCVHRDLATRNVLLSSINKELICKLSDFGLARTMNNKEEYRMESNGRVPVRWMAPESIRDNLYTTKSDVWSFGVVCWELVTMGSHPYGGYKAAQVIKMVLHGQTLEKPENCSKELYDVIMTSCWQQKYSRRPGFTNLRKQLEVMLVKAEDYISPMNLNSDGYVYLKPGNWDNTDEDAKPKKKGRKRTIPNNYELQFEGRGRRVK